ncbi:MAG TPA: SDR family oxidoreductase [Caulobacterales bacterium]|nr:SDR family oxidoreductase [Caulobacterales bacterium]
MKIVVIGGSGLIGSKLVDVLRARGADVLAASPDTGVNTLTGDGLARAVSGADVVVDVSNSPSFEDAAVMEFFKTATANILAAERAAGVKHHVVLSVVGTQRLTDSGYMRAKAAQENLIKQSGAPYSILESTQFFEFIERVAKASLVGDAYRLPPALMAPIVSDDVVAALADIALGPPLNATVEIGGPEALPMHELARELLSAREDPHPIIPDPDARYYGARVSDRSLLPGQAARRGSLSFGDWLRQSITAD